MAQRVLIVEDEPDIRDLLVFHLERDGYHVTKARSGADALRQAQHSPPDLVLLDLMLPEMDGLEVCRRLRQSPVTQGIPIVLLTQADAPMLANRIAPNLSQLHQASEASRSRRPV